MASSRVTRVGASVLVSLLFAGVLNPTVLGAAPTPGQGASSAATATQIRSGAAAVNPATATTLYAIKGTVTGVGGAPVANIQDRRGHDHGERDLLDLRPI